MALYALLPLLWGGLLAQHLALGMAEAGQVWAVSMGGGWAWRADPHVIGFCQTLAVAIGLAGSVVLLRRLLLPQRLGWLVQALIASGLALAERWLVSVY